MKNQPTNPNVNAPDKQKLDDKVITGKQSGDSGVQRAGNQRLDAQRKGDRRSGDQRASFPLERAENEGMVANDDQELEGEGSYTAGRRYDQGVERSIAKGDTDKFANEAANALDTDEGDELREAEKAGKQGRKL